MASLKHEAMRAATEIARNTVPSRAQNSLQGANGIDRTLTLKTKITAYGFYYDVDLFSGRHREVCLATTLRTTTDSTRRSQIFEKNGK